MNMVPQSRSGFELNKWVLLAQVVLLVLLVFGFAVYTRINAPDKDVVNGIYRNRCCSDIFVNGSQLTQKGVTVPLEIKDMKFGLTGFVDVRFTNGDMQVSDEETAISFFDEGGRRALSLPIGGKDYTFRSAERWTAN